MQLLDRIEKRRFVGRELLLWLWFESETFEGTLSTREQGSFGLWIERMATFSQGKEATRIKGSQPTLGREAKESLLRGKTPESAAFHLLLGDRETTFILKADRMALSGLSLPAVLSDEEPAPPAVADMLPRRSSKKSKPKDDEQDLQHEVFYERMHLTREVEALLEALYADFLTLRLGPAWGAVADAIVAWARGTPPDAEAYRKLRDEAIGRKKPKAARG